jgi:hypothetical protein
MTKAPIIPEEPAPSEGNPATTGLPPEAYQTEQFKSPPDPVEPPVEPSKAVPVDTAPNQPYPVDGAPPPEGGEK